MDERTLDDIDRAILYYLQQDARRAFSDIAAAVDVSPNTVRNRIGAMEDAGVIPAYRAKVDYDAAGVPHHYVFVCTARVSRRDKLAEEVRSLSGVTEVITLMTGTHNVYVIGASAQKDAMTDLAYAVDEIGLTIEQEHLIRDHVRQPYSGFHPPGYMTNE